MKRQPWRVRGILSYHRRGNARSLFRDRKITARSFTRRALSSARSPREELVHGEGDLLDARFQREVSPPGQRLCDECAKPAGTRLLKLDQTPPSRARDSFGSTDDVEFGKDAFHMRLHRAFSNKEG